VTQSNGGKAVVVTGATGGIGAAVCRRLARDGLQVVAVDRDAEPLERLVGDLTGAGHLARPVDLTDLAAHGELMREVEASGRRLVGLVYLAAVLRRRNSIFEVTEEDWDAQIDTNLKATFFFNRSIAELLTRQASGGSIVNFTSQGWWTGGFGGSVVYAASKGGIVSMSRGLARTLAPHAIRVNTVAPGFVDTPMMRSGLTDAQLQASVEQVPWGRMAEPEEVADTVSFLIGNDSRYMTGATLNVTGGQLMY
jgi:NAD(P)-dependent dehydrogenase (short-subunit alcohol dehydrogenase family)